MQSDAAYALLYQNKTMAGLLLRAWAPAEIAVALDYATLRSEPTKNYDADGRRRTGDLLFTVRLRSGERVWVAVLLEMQSSNDRMMAWRLLSYATLFGGEWRARAACNKAGSPHFSPWFCITARGTGQRAKTCAIAFRSLPIRHCGILPRTCVTCSSTSSDRHRSGWRPCRIPWGGRCYWSRQQTRPLWSSWRANSMPGA